MKKCRYCGRENEEAAVACRECGEALDEAPASPMKPEALDPALSPVVVATFNSLPAAKLLADRLEAAGIETYIPEEFAPPVFSAVIPLEQITVRVAAKDYEAAKALAAAHVLGLESEVPGDALSE